MMSKTPGAKRTPGKKSIQRLVGELQALDELRQLGDVRDKAYLKRRDELLQQIGREKVQAWMEPGEEVLGEYHFVQTHFPFTRLAFQDASEETTSFYATRRRLFRWRFRERPCSRIESLCAEDNLESLRYDEIQSLARGREFRRGEALVSVIILALAVLLSPLLHLTGPLLVVIGLFGLVHSLLLPTRYVLVVAGERGGSPWRLYVADKKAAYRLVDIVRQNLPI